GFGTPWCVDRSWTNNPAYFMPQGVVTGSTAANGNLNGAGWIDNHLPYLLRGPTDPSSMLLTLIAVSDGTTARYFTQTSMGATTYQAPYFDQTSLTYVPASSEYVLTDSLGNQTHYFDFTTSQPGQFKSYTDSTNHTTYIPMLPEAAGLNADGTVAEVRR